MEPSVASQQDGAAAVRTPRLKEKLELLLPSVVSHRWDSFDSIILITVVIRNITIKPSGHAKFSPSGRKVWSYPVGRGEGTCPFGCLQTFMRSCRCVYVYTSI